MSVTNRALFIIERSLHDDLGLEDIARRCEVSRFHLAHAFGQTVGLSVIDYYRGRRLSEAARVLAGGAQDILSLALESGYASHEAFSRAFKARFGQTPDAVRAAKSIGALLLVEPHPLLESKAMTLTPPRIEQAHELLFVGLTEHVPYQQAQRFPALWSRFMTGPYAEIENRLDDAPVGLTTGSDETGIDYACAAGVAAFGHIPQGCVKIRVAPAAYAVFSHDGHVTELRETYRAIWDDWFPASRYKPAEAPGLERHNPTFDPRTGKGGVTIWLPVEG